MKKEQFICDGCNKKKIEKDVNDSFPYREGWLYLHDLDFKVCGHFIEKYKDKHFCTVDCMVKFIEKTIRALCLERKELRYKD